MKQLASCANNRKSESSSSESLEEESYYEGICAELERLDAKTSSDTTTFSHVYIIDDPLIFYP